MIKFKVDPNRLAIKLVEIPKLCESELLSVRIPSKSEYLDNLILSIQDKECNVTLCNACDTFNWWFPLDKEIVLFTELDYNTLISAFNRLPSLISYDIKEEEKAIPKVIFKVKQLPPDLGFEILGIDYDDTTVLDLAVEGYKFSLNSLGFEIQENSNNITTSIIVKNRKLVPSYGLLKYKMVVGTYELEHLVKLLNESQRDVFFEILVCEFRA